MVLTALYTITRLETGETYVGTTSDPRKRWRNHIRRARSGSTQTLHQALTLFGHDAFEFEVHEWLNSLDEATLQEAYWIERLQTFNVSLFNKRHRVPSKRKLSKKEVSTILSNAQQGKGKSEAHCESLRKAALLRWAKKRGT